VCSEMCIRDRCYVNTELEHYPSTGIALSHRIPLVSGSEGRATRQRCQSKRRSKNRNSGGRGVIWGPCVVLGVSGPETKVPAVTHQAAKGFDLEQPAKNKLEPAARPGSCNLRAATVGANGVVRTGKDEPHKSPFRGRANRLARKPPGVISTKDLARRAFQQKYGGGQLQGGGDRARDSTEAEPNVLNARGVRQVRQGAPAIDDHAGSAMETRS